MAQMMAPRAKFHATNSAIRKIIGMLLAEGAALNRTLILTLPLTLILDPDADVASNPNADHDLDPNPNPPAGR